LHECDDVRRIGDEVEALDESSIPALEAFMMRYQNVLHPNHYHCLGVLNLLCQLYGKAPGFLINNLTEAQLRHKRNLCRQLLKVVDVLEPGYSRLRGKFCTIKNKLRKLKFEVPKAMTLTFFFWEVVPSNLAQIYQCFGGKSASFYRTKQKMCKLPNNSGALEPTGLIFSKA
jgi:hypothetical protein